MTIIGQINRRTDEELAIPGLVERQCDWARANGLDPKEVALTEDTPVTVEEVDGQPVIRYHVMVRGQGGRVHRHLDADGRIVTEERLAPLVVPMPDRWDA